MLFAMFFTFWRFLEIITLIPTMGMLAWFVNGFVKQNELTPNYILILFIVSVLALAWALFTLFSYHRSSSNSHFVGLIDLLFVGAFIGAVYTLRFIGKANCTHISTSDAWVVSAGNLFTLSGHGIDITTNKPCAMLKAAYAFGIMNAIFFFFSAILAWMHGGHLSRTEKDRKYVRETTTVRRHRSSGASGAAGSRRSRSGSHRSSHRSSHSHQRVYV